MVASILSAQTIGIRGVITYQGGAKIPKGNIEIELKDPGAQGDAILKEAAMWIESDGGSKSMSFSLPIPASWASSPTHQVVAQLLREDGWLLARGSAQIEAGKKVSITLNTVMY